MVFVEPIITGKCNFRCNMCDFWKKATPLSVRTQKELPPIIWADIFNELGATKVHFKAVEPLMYEGFDELVIASRAPNRLLFLTTNAWFLDEHIEAMKYFHNIAITIGGIEERHDEPRGVKDAYYRAMYAVDTLKAMGQYVRVSFPITPENVDQMVPLYELLKEKHVPIIFNHMCFIHPKSCEDTKIQPINLRGPQPEFMDVGALFQAVSACKGANFQPRLTTRQELEEYYHHPPTQALPGKACSVLKQMLAGERYVIHPNGRFRFPSFCWVKMDLGSALEGKKQPKDSESLKELVAQMDAEGLPAACQRLCCGGKCV